MCQLSELFKKAFLEALLSDFHLLLVGSNCHVATARCKGGWIV